MQNINTFYVIDFDRCLGDVDVNFNLLKKTVHELSIIDDTSFQLARDKAEASGISFSVFEYIKRTNPNVNLDAIETAFIKSASKTPEGLLLPGAIELIKFLQRTNRDFCIMSCGDERWQRAKIVASGLGNLKRVIVTNPKKGEYISEWLNSKNSKFTIPAKLFYDDKSKQADEVVLVDDKAIAFEGLPVGTRGYLVYGSAYDNKKPHLSCPILKYVVQIKNINEIINLET